MLIRVPLTPQHEAHVALIQEVHAAAMTELKQLQDQANAKLAQRLLPLRTDLNIPLDVPLSVEPRTATTDACFTYEGPDSTPTRPGNPQAHRTIITDTDLTAHLAVNLPGATWRYANGRDAFTITYKGTEVTIDEQLSARHLSDVFRQMDEACAHLLTLSPSDPPAPDARSRSVESTSADAPEL